MASTRWFLQLTFAVLLAVLPAQGGEQGTCIFEGQYCSCKLGEENKGVCWDLVSGTPSSGTCKSRFCRAGWVCSCPGRSHVCELKSRAVNVVDKKTGEGTADCHEEVVLKPLNALLKLGTWSPSFSRKGLSANACRQVAWWYNGDLMAVYGKDPEINAANLDTQMEIRTNHTLFDFKKGDVIAFRFKEGSYHCYNHLSELNINGSVVSSTDATVETLFARGHTPNWYSPTFSPVVKPSEATASATDFTPLRSTMSSGAPDVPGDDNWKAADGSEDHKISNFYFRITL